MAIETKIAGAAEYGQHMKVLICGSSGAGKTLMSSTFPDPYYISAEGGMMSIARRFLPYMELTHTPQLKEMLVMLRQPAAVREQQFGVPIKTVVVDTIDEVQKIFMKERVKTTKKDAFVLQDYGWLNEQMQSLIRAFRNLDLNVIFTCHLKDVRDEELGTVTYMPGLAGQAATYITSAVDLAFLLTARSHVVTENGKTKKVVGRVLQVFPDQQHPWIKDRSGRIPGEMDVNFEDDYARLYEMIYGNIDAEFASIVEKIKQDAPGRLAALAGKRPDALADSAEYVCSSCGETSTDPDAKTMSEMKHNVLLCQSCLDAR